MSEFLLELLSEEVPAGLQDFGARELEKLILKGLKEAGLKHGESHITYGPRRLALVIQDVEAKSPDISEERKGPRVGAPEKALAGFLRGAGLDNIDQCEIQSKKKGEFYVAKIEKAGRPATEILADVTQKMIENFPWPKSMRWGTGKLRWVRPLHSILALFDGKVVPFEIGGIKSGNKTYGHRFMAPDAITIKDFGDYDDKLVSAFVEIDTDDRQRYIMQQIDKLAKKAGLELVEDAALLAETAGLVEWPVVLMGDFDKSFLEVPQEVLMTSMKKHQKCFSLKNPKTGKLANKFLLVSNMVADDGGKAITHGNERVIRARLSDAVFFWEQDLKTPLDEMAKKLDNIIFHEKLGSQGKRVKRIAALARELAPLVGADPDDCERAAKLCKADLVSEMVGEFANLQGLMGRYYAEQQGESDAVAAACEEHYRPQGPSDAIPTAPVSIAVALADKLDILTGFFGVGDTPTGSKDPFALRRAALGVIRIIMENSIRLDLFSEIFESAMLISRKLYKDGLSDSLPLKVSDNLLETLYEESFSEDDEANYALLITHNLITFFAQRLIVYLRDKGARHDLINAVFAYNGHADILMIVRRVEALGSFLETDDGANLLAGIKRAANILRIEEKKDKRSFDQPVDVKLLTKKAETRLFAAIEKMDKATGKALKKEDFAAAMKALAALRAPVDAFFDKVTVNDEDKNLRTNRLALLAQIRRATTKIADFSKIEG